MTYEELIMARKLVIKTVVMVGGVVALCGQYVEAALIVAALFGYYLVGTRIYRRGPNAGPLVRAPWAREKRAPRPVNDDQEEE